MNELRPTFSVIIPVYNTRQTLPGMLRSALAQTCADFEIVIVDDGSTDGGLDAIQSMLDNRCRVFTQANRGVSGARNRGLSEARGRYVALLDADDYWFPDHLETARQFFALYPEIRWYCASWVKTATVELVQSMPRATASYEILNYFESGYLATEHPVWTSAVIFAKEMAANPALFPEDLYSGEDLYTWCLLGLIPPAWAGRPV